MTPRDRLCVPLPLPLGQSRVILRIGTSPRQSTPNAYCLEETIHWPCQWLLNIPSKVTGITLRTISTQPCFPKQPLMHMLWEPMQFNNFNKTHHHKYEYDSSQLSTEFFQYIGFPSLSHGLPRKGLHGPFPLFYSISCLSNFLPHYSFLFYFCLRMWFKPIKMSKKICWIHIFLSFPLGVLRL